MGQKINLTTEIDLDELLKRAEQRVHGTTLELIEEMVRQKLNWDGDQLDEEIENLFDKTLKEWTVANKAKIQADIKAALSKGFDKQVDEAVERILYQQLGIE
jgi:hypothetical protein